MIKNNTKFMDARKIQSYLAIILFFSFYSISAMEMSFSNRYIQAESTPVSVNSQFGLDPASGVTLRNGIRIYKGLGKDESDVKVFFKNGDIWQWSTDTGMGFVDSFKVLSIDILGTKEYLPVIDNYLSSTNGIGVSNSEIEILDHGHQIRPLLFQSQDFDERSFLFNSEKIRTEILTGEWVSDEKDILYFVGSWFYVKDGQLIPVLEKPVIKRRFTYAFEKQKNSCQQGPLEWLSNGKLIKCDEDPWLKMDGWDKVSREESKGFKIKNLKIIQRDGYIKMLMELEDSLGSKTYEYPGDPENYAKHLPYSIDRLGDKKSKRLYPQGYIPAVAPTVEGQDATLELLYSVVNKDYSGEIEKRVVLWF